MSAKKPIPADFAEMVAKLSGKKALMSYYNVGQKALYRWVAEAGLSLNDGRSAPRDCRHAPADFAAVAPTMSKEALRAHYAVGTPVLQRWINETGVNPSNATKPRRELPANFSLVAPTMAMKDLPAHYGVSKGVIHRWLEETGTKAFRLIAAPKKTTGGNLRPSRGNGGSNVVQLRTGSIFEQAADELRRNRWAVNRCDEKGLYAESGQFWRVGTVICGSDELLARAERCRRKAA